jgi:hypothetical protein
MRVAHVWSIPSKPGYGASELRWRTSIRSFGARVSTWMRLEKVAGRGPSFRKERIRKTASRGAAVHGSERG